jgi:hypothetical protein
MKKSSAIFIICNILLEVFFITTSRANNNKFEKIYETNKIKQDTGHIPECIKKLSKSSSKGIRSSIGSLQYVKKYTLKDGRTLYTFQSNASIGCHVNEPECTKYYNDSCKMVAKFPMRFSIKQGFKPFIAAGYAITDFEETSKGDYPAYFAVLEKATEENKIAAGKTKPAYPFPVEKYFTIALVKEAVLDFKKGDVISVSTKNGLKHYRNKQLLNTFKIIPQLMVAENRFVYLLGDMQRLIDVQNDTLFLSTVTFNNNDTNLKGGNILWKSALLLTKK